MDLRYLASKVLQRRRHEGRDLFSILVLEPKPKQASAIPLGISVRLDRDVGFQKRQYSSKIMDSEVDSSASLLSQMTLPSIRLHLHST